MGKLRELRQLLPDIAILSLKDISFHDAVDEPYDRFEENALAKASAVFQYCGQAVIADDSGLCVDALQGAPGVHSARYAGAPCNDARNNAKLIAALQGVAVRSAHYVAVICLVHLGKPFYFRGICEGSIAESARGTNGFGYDPLFIPHGFDQTFGELQDEIKHKMSHRAKAVKQLVAFIKSVRGDNL